MTDEPTKPEENQEDAGSKDEEMDQGVGIGIALGAGQFHEKAAEGNRPPGD